MVQSKLNYTLMHSDECPHLGCCYNHKASVVMSPRLLQVGVVAIDLLGILSQTFNSYIFFSLHSPYCVINLDQLNLVR